MIKKIDITDLANAEKVLQVQLLSYQIEAEIIGYEDLPPLKESAADLQHSGETFYGYYAGEDLGGVISFKMEHQEIDIHRLVVSPVYFRQGIAQKLLDKIQANPEAKSFKVATASKNEPAIAFYIKNGFQHEKESTINAQLTISFFEKAL